MNWVLRLYHPQMNGTKSRSTQACMCAHTHTETHSHTRVRVDYEGLVHANMEAENDPTSTSWKAGVLPTKYQPKPEVGGWVWQQYTSWSESKSLRSSSFGVRRSEWVSLLKTGQKAHFSSAFFSLQSTAEWHTTHTSNNRPSSPGILMQTLISRNTSHAGPGVMSARLSGHSLSQSRWHIN